MRFLRSTYSKLNLCALAVLAAVMTSSAQVVSIDAVTGDVVWDATAATAPVIDVIVKAIVAALTIFVLIFGIRKVYHMIRAAR